MHCNKEEQLMGRCMFQTPNKCSFVIILLVYFVQLIHYKECYVQSPCPPSCLYVTPCWASPVPAVSDVDQTLQSEIIPLGIILKYTLVKRKFYWVRFRSIQLTFGCKYSWNCWKAVYRINKLCLVHYKMCYMSWYQI